MKRIVYSAALGAAILWLGGCDYNQLQVQKNYIKERDACQMDAERRVAARAQNEGHELDPKEKNARLVQAFSKCMLAHNWDLGKPKDPTPTPPGGGGIIDTARTKPAGSTATPPTAAAPAAAVSDGKPHDAMPHDGPVTYQAPPAPAPVPRPLMTTPDGDPPAPPAPSAPPAAAPPAPERQNTTSSANRGELLRLLEKSE